MKKQFVKSSLKKQPSTYHIWQFLGLGLIFVGVVVAIAWLIVFYFHQQPLASPVNQFSRFKFINNYFPIKKNKKKVYGFLPYWNLNRAQFNQNLTDVAYFRLAINNDGNVQVTDDNKPEMGYKRLQSDQFLDIINQLDRKKINLEIVFTIFNDKTATKFLNSDEAKQEFLQNLDSIILAYPVQGINLDVELSATTGAQLKPQFTQFVQEVSNHLKTKPHKIQLSIDVYPSATSGQHIWDLNALAKSSDFIILMAYDFHQRGSSQAGPVAPIFSDGGGLASSIHNYLKKTLKQVPAEKLLLGIPFYGYQWQTVDHSEQANTYPDSGSTVLYRDLVKLLQQKDPSVTRHWNAKALSPYLTYQQDGKKYVVYYDDKNSIHYKLELVNQLDLGGIAIWALGYEGGTEELWQEIGQSLSK